MKRFLLSFVMIFALLLMTNAQVLLQEGFENGIPSTWTTIDNDGDGFNWCAKGFAGHTGETCISSSSGWNSNLSQYLTPDNWLITPQIDLTGNAILKFYIGAQSSYYNAEHYAVLISTTGNAVSDFTDTLLEETYTAPTAAIREPTSPFVEKTIDLSAYTGQQVYIAFRHYNTVAQDYVNLDDVRIMIIPTTPTIYATETSYNFGIKPIGETATWTTIIENYNLTEPVTATVASPFSVSTDGTTYGQTATIPATGGTLYVIFTPTSQINYLDTIQLISAGAPDASITVEGRGLDCDHETFPYFCTFTDEEMYCWQIVDANNDGYTFENSNDGYAYYSISIYDADDYLISPQFDFNGGVYLALDYYAPYASWFFTSEKFQVLAVGADTIQLTEVMTIENVEAETLLIDLDNLVGRYSIAMHCVSDPVQDNLNFSNFGIYEYEDGHVDVDVDSLDFSRTALGQDKVLPVKITNFGVTDTVTYSATAPFQVSLDNVNFASQAVRTAPAGNIEYDTLYVKFAPTIEGVIADFVTITYLSNVDSIRVKGEGVDCSEGITEFPYEFDFNARPYPPVCWTVNDPANYEEVIFDEDAGEYGLAFLAVDRLVTPELHSANPLLLSFEYSSFGGALSVTSFVVGYSMNTVAEEDFIWYEAEVADNEASVVETYSNIIPANAKYAAIKVTEMNEFVYYDTYTNYLFVDNFAIEVITEPMMMLSANSVDFKGLLLGENRVDSVEVSSAFLTSPITVSGQAEFTVSENGITFGASATLPAEGGIVYIKYEPTNAGTHTGVVAMTSGTTTVAVAVRGRGYDCEAVETVPYYEGFEDYVEGNMYCWDNIDADGDGYSWKLRADAYNDAHTGIACVYSESYIYGVGALTPDNFFISPVIAIPEGGASLEWFAYACFGDNRDDYYSVLIYTEENVEGTVVFSEVLNSEIWERREVDLLDYAGSNIRFAFRHHNCTRQWTIAIDDIQVTASVGVERNESHEVTLGIYPNPASNMININASENMQKIQVLNMAGQCVYSSQVGGNNTQVNVSNMADGLYFVKVYTDSGNVSTKKIVVRK